MRVFFDTNILLDQIDEKRKGHQDILKLEECLKQQQAVILCAWHSLSIVEYVGKKVFQDDDIYEALRHLLSYCVIPETGTRDALEAFAYLNGDYEDALQVAAAVAGRADYFVSNDQSGGFEKSPVKVVTSKEFVRLLNS